MDENSEKDMYADGVDENDENGEDEEDEDEDDEDEDDEDEDNEDEDNEDEDGETVFETLKAVEQL